MKTNASTTRATATHYESRVAFSAQCMLVRRPGMQREDLPETSERWCQTLFGDTARVVTTLIAAVWNVQIVPSVPRAADIYR